MHIYVMELLKKEELTNFLNNETLSVTYFAGLDYHRVKVPPLNLNKNYLLI